MRARLSYKKLMLYHNIIRSDERRPVKRILEVQEKEGRERTWHDSIMKEMDQFTITLDPKQTLKSTWKKEVKERITRKMGEEIREKCKNSKKARIVQHDLYQRKDYLNGKASLKETQNILRTRMNMIKIPGNYKGRGDGWCPLCEETEGSTEHYFECSK